MLKIFLVPTSLALTFIALAAPNAVDAQAPPSDEAYLGQHNIPNTVPALRSALSSPDPQVRGVAASILAQRKDDGTASMIRDALSRETDLGAKVSLAAALAALRDPFGLRWLTQMCNSPTAPPLDRLYTANRVRQLGSDACSSTVIEVLAASPGHDATGQGLEYLRSAHDIPPQQLRKLRSQLNDRLHDSQAENREDAARVLALVGDATSVQPLETAISAEKDEGRRHRLEESLQTLKARIQSGAS